MHKSGFTLIELLTIVAIMGILIVTGYPSYKTYLRETRRQEAIQEILSLQIMIEDAIAKNNALPDPTVSPYNVAPYITHTSKNNLYTITYSRINTTDLTYEIKATALGDQANDKVVTTNCTPLTLNNTIDGITPYVCK